MSTNTQPEPTAAQLACEGCGGSFGLAQLTPEVSCPYCARRQHVAPELMQRMSVYRNAVDARLAQIAQQQHHVAAADRFMDNYASRGGFAGAYLAVVGVPIVLGGGYVLLQRLALLPSGAVATAAYAVVVALVAFAVARFVFGVGASDTAALTVGEVAVACPECGAPGTLGVGATAAVCSYCSGQLVATALAVEHGVDAATQAQRRAMLQRLRKEREVMLHVNRPPRLTKPLVLAWCVVVIGGIVYAAFDHGPDEGLMALAVAMLLIAGGAAFVLRDALRERERLRAYRDLAQQLHAGVDHGVHALVAWLNRYWPTNYPLQHLYSHAHLIETNTGFATLIALKQDRAEAFLAADMADTSGSEHANREKKQLRGLGFVVKTSDAGAWLEASPELLKRLAHDVEVHRLFAPAVSHAARMLAAMGARRAAPADAG